jgi:hypothetical protein
MRRSWMCQGILGESGALTRGHLPHVSDAVDSGISRSFDRTAGSSGRLTCVTDRISPPVNGGHSRAADALT